MNINFQEQVRNKTDSELFDIYVNSDEYQDEFIKVVLEELKKRNVSLESSEIEKAQKLKFAKEVVEEGKQGNQNIIALCFISALLGGIIGIIAGYVYGYSSRKDSAGVSHYVYNSQTRKLGAIMMLVGIFVFILTMGLKSS